MIKRLAILVGLVAACGGGTPAVPDAMPDAETGRLMVTGQAVILTGDCRPYVVTGAPAAIELTGVGQGHAFATASDCASGASPMTTLTDSTFYFRDDIAEMVTLTATVPGATGSLAIEAVSLGVLGEPDASSELHLAAAVQPYAIASGGGKLVAVDTIAPRVLIWSAIPTAAGTPADLVLGQPDLQTSAHRAPSLRVSTAPTAVWTDGTRLLVAEGSYSRILGWRTFPTTTDQPADFVLGQPDATSITSPSATASSLSFPTGIASDGTRLFVADNGNNRVLVWSAFPTTTGAAASFALGQPDLVSSDGGTSATQLDQPFGIVAAGGALFVGDSQNHRVLGWHASSTLAANTPADFALGQADLVSGDARAPGADAIGRSEQLASDGTRLYVADPQYNRVLVWTALPSSTDEPADLVLGQATFAADAPGDGAAGISNPDAVATDGTRVFLGDANGRMLVYAAKPAMSGAPADFALGQPAGAANLTQATTDAIAVSGATLYRPGAIYTDGVRVFVADSVRNRVLVWNSIPRAPTQPADFALGQPDLASRLANRGAGPTASTLSNPTAVTSDGTRLFVADSGNHRVLVWNALPISTHAADIVLGQASATASATAPMTLGSLSSPSGVAVHAGKLVISDTGDSRVLVWNAIPTTTGTAADFALGAPGLGASLLSSPTGIAFAGVALAVADQGNSRVLVWRTVPTASSPADLVLGQPDFTTNDANHGGVSASSLAYPSGVTSDGTRLAVTDGNHRVLVWDALPAANNAAATHVLGQPDATSASANRNARLSATSLFAPTGALYFAGQLFVADTLNDRILRF